MPAGRPTKLTPEVQKTVCDTVSGGGTDRVACLRAGISVSGLGEWKRRGAAGEEPYAAFLAAYKRAEGDFGLRNLALIGKAAQDGTWQAAAWLLERRYPEEYGRKVVQGQFEHSGPGGGPLEVAVGTVSMDELMADDEGRALLSRIATRLCPRNGDAAHAGDEAD